MRSGACKWICLCVFLISLDRAFKRKPPIFDDEKLIKLNIDAINSLIADAVQQWMQS